MSAMVAVVLLLVGYTNEAREKGRERQSQFLLCSVELCDDAKTFVRSNEWEVPLGAENDRKQSFPIYSDADGRGPKSLGQRRDPCFGLELPRSFK